MAREAASEWRPLRIRAPTPPGGPPTHSFPLTPSPRTGAGQLPVRLSPTAARGNVHSGSRVSVDGQRVGGGHAHCVHQVAARRYRGGESAQCGAGVVGIYVIYIYTGMYSAFGGSDALQ